MPPLACPVEIDLPPAGQAGSTGMALMIRLARGNPLPSDMIELQRGAAVWLRAGGDIDLETALRLPGTTDKRNDEQRNMYLREAALHVRADRRCADLAALWGEFLDGPWKLWRDDGEPPAHANPLQAALFYASRHHRSSARGSLDVRSLRRILNEGGHR